MTVPIQLLYRLAFSAFLFIPFLRAEGSDWKIVLPDSPVIVEKTAAGELQTHIEQMTGEKVPICAESNVSGENGHLLLVGRTKIGEACVAAEHPEPFLFDEIFIKAEGTNLILIGHEQRGTIYAVYTFLEDVCGCRWFAEDVSRIPKLEQFSFPADLKISYAPKLIFRQVWNTRADNPIFSARNKGNSGADDAHGGAIEIRYGCHTFYRYIDPKIYFADHPEWFSEVGGKRTCDDAQLCLTNDEMREELTRRVLEDLREHPETKIIDISQNDYPLYCTCEKCSAVDAEEGSHAGTLIRFLNQVAADIEKEFPDVLIETLIYQYTRTPPKLVKPHKNLVLRLCSIECDFGRPLDGPTNTDFQHDLVTWSELATRLFIWDYVTNYDDYIGPHPNWGVLGPNIRDFTKNKAIGLFEEGEGDDFCEMKNWVLLKLMWNPDLDTETLMNEFAETYYGKEAAPFVMDYWRLLDQRILDTGVKLGCFMAQSDQWLDLETLNKATILMNKAQQAVAACGPDSPEAEHLRRSRLALDSVWLKRYGLLKIEAKRKNLPFEGPADFKTAAQEFSDLCIKWKLQGPDIHIVGKDGVEWFKNLPTGTLTPTAVPMNPAEWNLSGASIDGEELRLDGSKENASALYRDLYEPTELTAQLQFAPNENGALGFVFSASKDGGCSFVQISRNRITAGTRAPDGTKNLTFNEENDAAEADGLHTVRLRFTNSLNLIALFLDDRCVYQWISHPTPEQKKGTVGFFAEGGNVTVKDFYVTSPKLEDAP